MSLTATDTSLDVLSVVFFLVAGGWLVAALLYSLMVLCFLRLRNRGTLGSMYDEDFGRIPLGCFGWGERFYIPLGGLFRRYARHLNLDEASGNNSAPRRYMTIDERRAAMEILLMSSTDSAKAKSTNIFQRMKSASNDITESSTTSDADDGIVDVETGSLSDTSDDGGTMCSICLGGYDDSESVFLPKTCSHQFHSDCILDWLQRQANTECPCCRECMVCEEDVWLTVKKSRKAKRKQMRLDRRKLDEPKEEGLDDLDETEEPTEHPDGDEEYANISESPASVHSA